jgi:prepilin-type N-terminal cleavage/methylation domain-containing protein
MSTASDRRSSRRRLTAGAAQCMADSSGFTLLEVLAALTILAIALSALYNSFGTALRARDGATDRLAATQLAQSLLSQQILSRAIEPAVSKGRQGQYQWVIAVRPFEDEPPASRGQTRSRFEQKDQERAPPPPPDQWKLFEISITVNWPRNRSMRLDTLHLARAQ